MRKEKRSLKMLIMEVCVWGGEGPVKGKRVGADMDGYL